MAADGGARAQELLPVEEPDTEKQSLVATVLARSRARRPELLLRRGWQERYFSTWRRAFRYHYSPGFGESLEISFRGAVWLLLFSIPIIWGEPGKPLWVHEHEFSGAMLDTGACLCFVYTTAPTIGRTLSNAFHGLAGTVMSAAYSLAMYLVYPDGCSEVRSFELCYVFGVLAGAASIWLCLLLRLNLNFKVFYCSNFVCFWMAFLDPDAPKRTAETQSVEWKICGFEFADWGGGVFSGVMSMISGASLAIIVALLPYPMTSIEKARDSAVETVGVLKKGWLDSVAFYVVERRDDRSQAKMLRALGDIKTHVCTLKQRLDGSGWEMCFLWYCGRSWRLTHAYLAELEATTTRCLDRLSHVVGACMHEEFDAVHHEFMRPERCGNAVEALVSSANGLFGFAMECVEDGDIGEGEREKLLRDADGVEKDVATLTRHMRRAIEDINEMELRKRAGRRTQQMTEEVFQDTAKQLNDEQIFMFSLCDFAMMVQRYSTWLAKHNDSFWQASHLTAGLQEFFNKEAIMTPENHNSTLRHSLAIFLAFAVGYVGYSTVIPAKSTIIPGTVCVLLAETTSSPISKSLGRLQGVVVGKFAGVLAYAMLGWCASFWQASLSALVFSYVFLTLFVYNYTSPFSYLGCLAAAFGTKNFLQGCSSEVVGVEDLAHHATDLAGMLIAIVLMTTIDLSLLFGHPSELAYCTYLDAWKMWHRALELLLLPGEDVQVDLESIAALVNQAEALAVEARTDEPRCGKPPFPGDLFSEMIHLARTMRIEVLCILTVVCEKRDETSAVVDGREGQDGTSFSKKEWFNDLLKDEDSGWPEEIAEVLEEIDRTLETVEQLAAQNGHALGIDRQAERDRTLKTLKAEGRKRKVGRMRRQDSGAVNLVDCKMVQTSFLHGCLQTIKSANINMQLAILQNGIVS